MKRSISSRFLLFAFALVVMLGTWVVPPDAPAKEQVQQGLKRALFSFAVARGISAVLSVAEGFQVEVAPAGVGLGLTPGRLLQPLRELSDQFAGLMLAASVSFGIQLAVLAIGAHWLLSALLSAALAAWLVLRWMNVDPASRGSRFASTALLVLLLARFAVPLSAIAGEVVFRQVLNAPYQEAMAAVDQSGKVLDDAQPDAQKSGQNPKQDKSGASTNAAAGPAGAADGKSAVAVLGAVPSSEAAASPGLWERWRQKLPSVPNPAASFHRMKQAADGMVSHVVRVIGIFLVQTVLMPLVFLWIVIALGRSMLLGGAARRR